MSSICTLPCVVSRAPPACSRRRSKPTPCSRASWASWTSRRSSVALLTSTRCRRLQIAFALVSAASCGSRRPVSTRSSRGRQSSGVASVPALSDSRAETWSSAKARGAKRPCSASISESETAARGTVRRRSPSLSSIVTSRNTRSIGRSMPPCSPSQASSAAPTWTTRSCALIACAAARAAQATGSGCSANRIASSPMIRTEAITKPRKNCTRMCSRRAWRITASRAPSRAACRAA